MLKAFYIMKYNNQMYHKNESRPLITDPSTNRNLTALSEELDSDSDLENKIVKL